MTDLKHWAERGVTDYDEIKELEMFGAALEAELDIEHPESDDLSSQFEEEWNREMDISFADSMLADEWLKHIKGER